MSTALSIKGKTQANDAVTSTINYVNPNATNEQLQSLASAMNALTTNTIVDVTRIDKNSLTAAVTKLPRNLALSQSSIAWSAISSDTGNPTTITLTGNGLSADVTGYVDALGYNTTSDNSGFLMAGLTFSSDNSGIFLVRYAQTGDASPTDTVKIFIPEDNTYQAATVTLTIT